MTSVTIAQGLTLDEEMFERSLEAVRECVPDRAPTFTWEFFTTRENWLLIPDVEHPEEPWYKAELVIKQGAPYLQTNKLNVWRRPDLRRSGAPMPHSHPWRKFTGHLLMGGYKEDRYEVERASVLSEDPFSEADLGGVHVKQDVIHQAGQRNLIDETTFHEVTEVLEPGRTLSLMDCGPGRKEGWGYLDPETGLYLPNKKSPSDPRFKKLFLDRNPHLK
ncbi:MAG TPA: hypothetical protein VJ841_02720 [Candidatus Saccharimonadales bacterium]|nr:hypothetical protein [Candidatus Saccharimonadales bacterium]